MDERERIVEELQRWPQVEFALLFGSRAGGRARPDSDWDIALYLDDVMSARERFELQRQVAAGLEPAIAVDVVVLNDVPPLVGHRALRGEILLMRDKGAFCRYFVRTVGAALDQAPMMRVHAEARRRRLQERSVG